MYHRWLDLWDARRTRRSEHTKSVTELALGADLAFPSTPGADNVDEFCALADQAVLDSASFYGLQDDPPEPTWENGWLSFPSRIATETVANNTVRAKVTGAESSDHALLVLHHWNATSRNAQLARFFAWRGFTVVELAMPYHLERSRPGSEHADDMLGPNLGRTIRSVRQAVLDGREAIRFLRQAGYGKISVLGISLGSWVAGLIAAHEPAVERASLFLTAGSLADMVWTGSATRHIRASLNGSIELSQLRRAWAPLSLKSYTAQLARPGLDLQLVLANRDQVVLPELSEHLVSRLQGVGAEPKVKRMHCGHYSLSLPPYIIGAGASAARFLRR